MTWKPKITVQEQQLAAALELYGVRSTSNIKICGYYPDLHIVGTNILIEVDGSVHHSAAARQRDRIRTQHLNQSGFRSRLLSVASLR